MEINPITAAAGKESLGPSSWLSRGQRGIVPSAAFQKYFILLSLVCVWSDEGLLLLTALFIDPNGEGLFYVPVSKWTSGTTQRDLGWFWSPPAAIPAGPAASSVFGWVVSLGGITS